MNIIRYEEEEEERGMLNDSALSSKNCTCMEPLNEIYLETQKNLAYET